MAYLTDIEIAQNAKMQPITEIAKVAGVDDKYLEQYGKYKAKISREFIKKVKEKKDGKLIVNTQIMNPMPVITGAAEYPQDIAKKLADVIDTTVVDAVTAATEAGNIKAVNVVLIGVLAKTTTKKKKKWIETIKNTVPAKFLDVNLKAFEIGYNM